jgi:hypothetical protein
LIGLGLRIEKRGVLGSGIVAHMKQKIKLHRIANGVNRYKPKGAAKLDPDGRHSHAYEDLL